MENNEWLQEKRARYAAQSARQDAIAKVERLHGGNMLGLYVSRSEARLLLLVIEAVDAGKRDSQRLDKVATRIRERMAAQIAEDMARIDAEFPEAPDASR